MIDYIQQTTSRQTGIRKFLVLVLFCLPQYLFAQQEITLNLADLHTKGKLTSSNRPISIGKEGTKQYIKVEGKLGEGMIWLPVDDFSQGTIEIVARGKDILQGSFVGVAFHAVNDSTYDNVYCRPFNFIASDPVRRIHAIQYVYAPNYHWEKLRSEKNGKYEKGIENAPRPNDWFTLTLQIEKDTVKAYINHAKTPSLVVKKLNQTTTGRIGLTGINYDMEQVTIGYQNK